MLNIHGCMNNMNCSVGWQFKIEIWVWCMPQDMATKHCGPKFCRLWMHSVLLYDTTMLYQRQGTDIQNAHSGKSRCLVEFFGCRWQVCSQGFVQMLMWF